jgi:hypothetical protein
MEPAPWETAAKPGAPAPWESADAAPAPPAPQPMPVPPPRGGFKLMPESRTRQILVIAFLVVFFIVGPLLIWLGRGGPGEFRKFPDAEELEHQKQLLERQRAEADEMFHRAVVYLRSEDDGNPTTRNRLRAELEEAGKKGAWKTEHYQLLQVTGNKARPGQDYDVVLVCMPLPGAADPESAGYARFHWNSPDVAIEWE